MARRARDDFCLVCLESPCVCGKASKKQPLKSLPKVETPTPPVQAPTKRAGLSAVRLPTSVQPESKPRVVIDNRRLDEPPTEGGPLEEQGLQRAVTLIVEILGVTDQCIKDNRSLISLNDNEIRAVQWRHRREYRAHRHD